MPFLLLLVLTLICLQREWPEPLHDSGLEGSLIFTWGGVVAFVAAGWLLALRARRCLASNPIQRSRLLRRFSAQRRYLMLGQVAFFLTALCLLGWGVAARDLVGQEASAPTAAEQPAQAPAEEQETAPAILPGMEVLLLAPLLLGLVLSWAVFYDMERVAHDTSPVLDEAFPGRWTYVGLQARHNLLLIAPPLLLVLVQQIVLAVFPRLQHDELLLPLFGAALLAAVFFGIPWLLRLMLGLAPLPEGPLRDRLLATARRLSFRFSDVLVWDTRNTVANAMVTGPLPWLRYVVLTDRLVREMSPEEVEAVFGHEVGHIKHRHMLFYFGFLLASLLVMLGLWNAVSDLVRQPVVQAFLRDNVPDLVAWLKAYKVVAMLPLVVLLGAYMFIVFGFLSRRCERQADIFGCRTVSCEVFIEALEKVARLNGISRDRPGWFSSWQHSTIARRVEFLQRMSADPALEPRFQRAVGYVKWGMVLSLTLVFTAVVWAIGPGRAWAMLKQL